METLPNCSNLELLNLKGNSIGKINIYLSIEVMKIFFIGDGGSKHISNSLFQNRLKNIKIIILQQNKVTSNGINALYNSFNSLSIKELAPKIELIGFCIL